MNASASPRPPLTDSPWFWAYLFATFALIALTVMRPRVLERQAQLERKQQGRQRAVEQAAGQEPQAALSTPSDTVIPLGPLFVVFGVVWIVSWVMLWRGRRAATQPSSTAQKEPSP